MHSGLIDLGRSRGLGQSFLYDAVMRLPIMGYSSFVLARDGYALWQQAMHDPTMFDQVDAGFVIAMLARVSQWMTIALLAVLPAIRLRPIAKSEEILPRIGAFVAVCLSPSFMLLERAPANLAFNLVSLIGTVAANALAVLTLTYLGRSFSVMPEARQVVKSGPYAIVRHPLYLCEMLGFLSIALLYRSGAAAMLLALMMALQIARARWEEKVLAGACADFAAYRARTPFLIPRDLRAVLALFVDDAQARRRSAMVAASVVALMLLMVLALPRLIV